MIPPLYFRYVFLALLPILVLTSSIDSPSCQLEGLEGASGQRCQDEDVARAARQDDDDDDPDMSAFIQSSVNNRVISQVEPEKSEQLPPWTAATSLHLALAKAQIPPAVADPGLDEWDAQDTVLVVTMIVVLAVFDGFFAPQATNNIRSHALALLFMVFASGVFCAVVWKQRGMADGVAWATGYALEWALSLDNLFVFHLVFKAFSVPPDQSIRALSIGIYGAVVFRVAFIVCLTQLFTLHYMVDIIVGGLLIVSGILTLSDSEEDEVQGMATVRFFKWLFGSRLLDKYSSEGRLFIRSDKGELQMTVLFLVVCVVSVVDCVFAVDSVGSKTGQIKNVYINLTSCLMAMFSLRSVFFIVKDMADYFDYVKYGICAILCFVGLEMIVGLWYPVPLGWVCMIICVLFVSSIVASVAQVVYCKSNQKGDLTGKIETAPEEKAVIAG